MPAELRAPGAPVALVLTCPGCGTTIYPGLLVRADARYCSGRCRQRTYRRRSAPLASVG
jgi:ribosomal protein L24E